MSAVHESSLTAAPSSVPPTVPTSTTSAGAPVASSSVPATGATGTSTGHATEDPVKALDHMAGEPSILDKAKGIAQPYLNKAQETTSPYIEKFVATTTPYLDNAAAKLEHLADRIEAKIDGTAGSTGTTSTTTVGDKSATPSTTTTTGGVAGVTNPERRTSIVDQIGDKAQGVFASVSNTFSKLTSTIDDKTKSPTHPGIVTQLSQAVDKVSEKVDAYLDGAPAQHPAALEHPVQTTTNSVPHPTIPSDPSTSTSAAPASSFSGAASHSAVGSSSGNTTAPSSSAPAASTGSSGSNGGSSSNEPKVDPNVDSRF